MKEFSGELGCDYDLQLTNRAVSRIPDTIPYAVMFSKMHKLRE
jgi:hypothetical protein